MSFVTIANAVVFLACFSAALASQVSFQLDEEAIKNHSLPKCRLRHRSNAANKQTIWAFSGESITFTICPKESGHVSFENVVYSNDGWVDNVSVLLDDEEIGKFVSTDKSKEGELWNVFHESGSVGETNLTPGKHSVTVAVRQADKWGIEFDELLLKFDKYWTADDIKCPDEAGNYGGRRPAYGGGYSEDGVLCGVDEKAPVKVMDLVQTNTDKTTTKDYVPETSPTSNPYKKTKDNTPLKPGVTETPISTESPTKSNDIRTKSDVSETTTTKQSTTTKDKTTTKADVPEASTITTTTTDTTTTTTDKSTIKFNSSVSLTNPDGKDMTIERANASFCSGGLAHFDVVSTFTTQITLTFSPPKQASMSPHSSFNMTSDAIEMYSHDSAHVQRYPGSEDDMWVSMGDSDRVPCSAIQLSAPDARGNMSSRFLMTSDGGMHLFPASSATSQAVFYPSVLSGKPGTNIASMEITPDESTVELDLKTEQAETRISVGLHALETTLTITSTSSRLTSLEFPCASHATKIYVAGDDGVFYSMLGKWKSLVGSKLQLRMETD